MNNNYVNWIIPGGNSIMYLSVAAGITGLLSLFSLAMSRVPCLKSGESGLKHIGECREGQIRHQIAESYLTV